MRKPKTIEGRCCSKCGSSTNQVNDGKNRSGTQRCKCKECNITYTLNPKTTTYPEEVRTDAIKTYFSGVSGRSVRRLKGFSKANVYNWLKKPNKVWISRETAKDFYEMDELYHFVGRKGNSETRENVYFISLISRNPRQLGGFAIARDKSPERIQTIVDSAPEAKNYCTDGYLGYIDIVYPGKHIRNVHNKNDTYTVEGINADIRHYMKVFSRRSRCFCRSLETLEAVLSVFINAFNKFGEAKINYRLKRNLGKKSRELPFGVIDFL